MSKTTLSAIIITKNEEDKIKRCLEKISWVDEIIVVDDLSEDKTVEICQQFGVKVIAHKSDGNFDRQRNIGIDNARSHWILQLDADEIISAQLREEIRETINNPDSQYVAYKIRRQNFFAGHFMKYGGWSIYYTKLFRKDSARYIGRSVHETLQVNGAVGSINNPVQHFPFTSIQQFVQRHNFYTSVEAKLMYEDKGRLPEKTIKYNLIIRPLKLFWKIYIKKKGFCDGMYGFLFSALNSWTHFLKWAKYWEICQLNAEKK